MRLIMNIIKLYFIYIAYIRSHFPLPFLIYYNASQFSMLRFFFLNLFFPVSYFNFIIFTQLPRAYRSVQLAQLRLISV